MTVLKENWKWLRPFDPIIQYFYADNTVSSFQTYEPSEVLITNQNKDWHHSKQKTNETPRNTWVLNAPQTLWMHGHLEKSIAELNEYFNKPWASLINIHLNLAKIPTIEEIENALYIAESSENPETKTIHPGIVILQSLENKAIKNPPTYGIKTQLLQKGFKKIYEVQYPSAILQNESFAEFENFEKNADKIFKNIHNEIKEEYKNDLIEYEINGFKKHFIPKIIEYVRNLKKQVWFLYPQLNEETRTWETQLQIQAGQFNNFSDTETLIKYEERKSWKSTGVASDIKEFEKRFDEYGHLTKISYNINTYKKEIENILTQTEYLHIAGIKENFEDETQAAQYYQKLNKKEIELMQELDNIVEKNTQNDIWQLAKNKFDQQKEEVFNKTQTAKTTAEFYVKAYLPESKNSFYRLITNPQSIKLHNLPNNYRGTEIQMLIRDNQNKIPQLFNTFTHPWDLLRANHFLTNTITKARNLKNGQVPNTIPNFDKYPTPDFKTKQEAEIEISEKGHTKFNPAALTQLGIDNLFLTAYNTSLETATPIKEALCARANIIGNGWHKTQELLQALGYKIQANEKTINNIEKLRAISNKNKAPTKELTGFEAMAYYENKPYTAQATLKDPQGNTIWEQGQQYLITPGWKRVCEQLSSIVYPNDPETNTPETAVNEYTQFTVSKWTVETSQGYPVTIAENNSRTDQELCFSIFENPNIQKLKDLSQSENIQDLMEHRREERVIAKSLNNNPTQEITIEAIENQNTNPNTTETEPEIQNILQHEIKTWAPSIEDFIQVFPPQPPDPAPITHHDEIAKYMEKIYKRFGPKYATLAKTGIPLNPTDEVLKKAKTIFRENNPENKTWEELPNYHPNRHNENTSTITTEIFQDKAQFLDWAEGRLNQIPHYQLHEAALGCLKKNIINNSIQGSGKTFMALFQAYAMNLKQVYIAAPTKLKNNWIKQCERLNLSIKNLNTITDIKNLDQKIRNNKQNKITPKEPEFYVISESKLKLGGKNYHNLMPWIAAAKLTPTYQKLINIITLWMLYNEETSPTFHQQYENVLLDKTSTQKIHTNTNVIDYLKNPIPTNPGKIPLETCIEINLDKSWIVDLQNLVKLYNTNDDPESRHYLNINNLTLYYITEEFQPKKEILELGLRLENKIISFEKQIKECPQCKTSTLWNPKNGTCANCGHAHTYATSKPSTLQKPQNDIELWASHPGKFKIKQFVAPTHKKTFHLTSTKKSKNVIPTFKLLPHIDGLIVDEFHKIMGNFNSQACQAILGLKTKYKILTSGTVCRTQLSQAQPALVTVHDPNSPEFPYSKEHIQEFENRFTTTKISRIKAGKDNWKQQTKQKLPQPSNPYALRKLLHGKTIGTDSETMEQQWGVKPIKEHIIWFQLNDAEKDVYTQHLEKIQNWISELKNKIKTGSFEEVKEARKQLLTQAKFQSRHLYNVCNGESKITKALEWAKNQHKLGNRFIIVCKDTKFFKKIEEAFKKENFPISTLDETVSADKREDYLDKWAEGNTHLLSRIKLIAEGYNQMVVATHILHLEIEDSPEDNRQLQKRVARIGQTKQTYSYFLLARNEDLQNKTIDQASFIKFIERDKAIKLITAKKLPENEFYSGPAEMINEYQAMQGQLDVLEAAVEATMSEIELKIQNEYTQIETEIPQAEPEQKPQQTETIEETESEPEIPEPDPKPETQQTTQPENFKPVTIKLEEPPQTTIKRKQKAIDPNQLMLFIFD